MSKSSKIKGNSLYKKMKASREQLVKKYEAAGTIRYDEAIGLIPIGGNPSVSQAPSTVGGTPNANNGRRETRINDYRQDGTLAGTRTVLDLEAIKAANIADGIPSGSMMDALKKRAEGKTILLFSNDAALRYGTVILGQVPCQLKLMGDIVNAIRNSVFPGFNSTANVTGVGSDRNGLVHALPGTIEQEALSHRGLYKPSNYRGDVEYLKDPTSIWSTKDAKKPTEALGSKQQQLAFGVQVKEEMESGVLKARGISINGCSEGLIENCMVSESQAGGFMSAVEIRGQSTDVDVQNLVVEKVSGADKAVGLKISKDTTFVEIQKMKVSDVSFTDEFGSSSPIEIALTKFLKNKEVGGKPPFFNIL